MKTITRNTRRIDAILKKTKAIQTGSPEKLVLGEIGRRRVIHFFPDGKVSSHRCGHTCMCDINWILDSIKDK